MSQPTSNDASRNEIIRIKKANPDYYTVLGLSKSATLQEIRKALRKKWLIVHPDKGGDYVAAMIINNAQAILLDPDKKSNYDAIYQYRTASTFAEEVTDILNAVPAADTKEQNKPNTTNERQKNQTANLTGVTLKFDSGRIALKISINPKNHTAYIEPIYDNREVSPVKINALMDHIFTKCKKLTFDSKLNNDVISLDFEDYDSKDTLNYLVSQVNIWAETQIARDKMNNERAAPKPQKNMSVESENLKVEFNFEKGTLRIRPQAVILDRSKMKELVKKLQTDLENLGFKFQANKADTPIQGPYIFHIAPNINIKSSEIKTAVKRVDEQVFSQDRHRRHGI